MSNPTLFRTEAISKLSEAVKNIRSTQQTLQSSPVISKSYQFGENDFWNGSVNLIQDKLGVFVIVSLGGKYERGNYFTTLRDTLNTIRPPILLNTESEVYRFCNAESKYYIGQSGDFKLYIYRDLDNTLKLTVECDNVSNTYDKFGFCIYGLIPNATLNIEEELSTQH